jgi:molybdate transport repressor ModE-like protein
MFSPETLKLLMDRTGDIVTPMFEGTGGHPVVISSTVIPEILRYYGDNGLRGAIALMEDRRVWVEVADRGILNSIHNIEQLKASLEEHNHALLHSLVNISLVKETTFFNPRIKLLLFLIMDTNSVNRACDLMALSLGKAWDMLNKLEKELGYPIVERRHGGSHGGRTVLTEQGLAFLTAYQQFEHSIFQHAHNEFTRLFRTSHIL